MAAAALLAGCMSHPPPPTVPPESPIVGESTRQIVARGYQIAPVFRFVVDGHQYAFATAYSALSGVGLVLIDGTLACTLDFEKTGPSLPEWQWVGEPDGLDYMAHRLRQFCGLEPATESRVLPPEPEAAAQEHRRLGADFEDDSVPLPVEVLGQALAMTVGVVWGPLLWIPEMIVGAATSPGATDSAALHRMQSADGVLSAEQLNAHLGRPELSFALPRVATTVYAFRASDYYRLYVGVTDGQVVWVRTGSPWLDELARQAREQQQHHQ